MYVEQMCLCRSLLDASNKLNLLCSILDRHALTPTADPGAALFGDYAFIQTTAGATQAPPPSAREASKAAGDLLPELIWPEGKEQEDLSLLALPSELASRLSQVRPTCMQCSHEPCWAVVQPTFIQGKSIASLEVSLAFLTVAAPSVVPHQTLYQTYTHSNCPLQTQPTCASGTMFRGATV